MISNVALLSLPLLAAGARHGLNHAHAHAHARAHGMAVEQRSAAADVVTVTDTVFVTITVQPATSSALQSPVVLLTSTSSSIVVPLISVPTKSQTNLSQPPAKETAPVDKPQNIGGIGFQTLQPVPNSAMVKNSCEYPVYIWSVGDPSCDGEAAAGKLIEANGTHVEKMRKCAKGGISLKISKTQDASKPMQFEYAIWKDQPDLVSYDISYLNCMNKAAKDLSDCAGHDGGIQAMGGGGGENYQCAANSWCDKAAYVEEEFGYKPGAPVSTCKVEKGVAFELCAGSG